MTCEELNLRFTGKQDHELTTAADAAVVSIITSKSECARVDGEVPKQERGLQLLSSRVRGVLA